MQTLRLVSACLRSLTNRRPETAPSRTLAPENARTAVTPLISMISTSTRLQWKNILSQSPFLGISLESRHCQLSLLTMTVWSVLAAYSHIDCDLETGVCQHPQSTAQKLIVIVQVHVDSLQDVKSNENGRGFERLVLPLAHKHIIKSQVVQHFRKRDLRTAVTQDELDLVSGKGQGLIILLHGRCALQKLPSSAAAKMELGAPGVGKTCTAEAIADLVHKPLYPITCGDLGSSAQEVEKNLKHHFMLASKWDCVMLLDEADVFLAKRKMHDIHRNSIVSVFLRILEYYKGLLFLTTNRVGSFDEAFKSRVHISLFCKVPSELHRPS